MADKTCVKGSATIEMAYIMSVFLGIFFLLVTSIFYFHDKCVLYAAAYETSVVGSQRERLESIYSEEELKEYFIRQTEDALIFFPTVEVSVKKGLEYITVEASAVKNSWKIHTEAHAMIMRTEELIYLKNALEKGSADGKKETGSP